MKTLFEEFEVLEDPRDVRGKKYKLIDLLIMTIYGILCGLEDYTNIAFFLKKKEEYFTKLLKLENGIPSHDCLSDIFSVINSEKFMEIFIQWTKKIIEQKTNKIISIDGKAVRAATDKVNSGNIPYIVSAFLGDIGVSIGQVKVEDKSNEITAIPELLDLIDIKDAYITIDAIGTQTKIAEKIVEKGGHYALDVKNNQKNLYKSIKNYFDSINNLNANKNIFKKIVKDKTNHGRTEKREYYLSYDVKTIKNEHWSSVNAVAYVRIERTIKDETCINDKYFIIDTKISIDKLVEVLRDHWNIETGLHWKLDVIMGEDKSRNRVKNSINNLSILRKIVFNLANLDTSLDKQFGNKKIPLRRKITNYMLDFSAIENLLFNIIPKMQ